MHALFRKAVASLTVFSIFFTDAAFCMHQPAPSSASEDIESAAVRRRAVSAPPESASSLTQNQTAPVIRRPVSRSLLVVNSPQSEKGTDTAFSINRDALPTQTMMKSFVNSGNDSDSDDEAYGYGSMKTITRDDIDVQSRKPLLDDQNPDLREAEKRLQQIEKLPFFVKWVYLDHLIEKMAYFLWLRKKDVTGVLPITWCNSDPSEPLWIEGRGIPLKSGYSAARGITGFRQGVEFVFKRSLTLILDGLLGYQIYQLKGSQSPQTQSHPVLSILKIVWEGDSTSIRGALAYSVQKLAQEPKYAPYFAFIFAAPFLWGTVKSGLFARRAVKSTPESFQEAINVVEDFSLLQPSGKYGKLWKDTVRWLLPLHSIDREVNYLVYRLLLDGSLTIDQRKAGLKALIDLTRNTQGWSKIVGLTALQKLAAGTSLSQLALVEKYFGKDYRDTLLREKARALYELQKQNPGIRKAGRKSAIHNLYANYLRWTLGDFDSIQSAVAWAVFKGGLVAVTINLFVNIVEQIIEGLRCLKALKQGFTYAMQPTFYSNYDDNPPCLQAYLDNFNKVPGQPPYTIVNLLSNFTNLDPSFFTTLNFTGRGVTGQQVGGLLQGFKQYQPNITFTTLDLSNNNIGSAPGDVEALVSFLPSSLTYLDLSGNINIGCPNNCCNSECDGTPEANEKAIGQAFPSLSQLRTLKLSHCGIGDTQDSGTIAIGNGLSFLPHLQFLDLSYNGIGNTGDNGTVAIGNSLSFLPNLQFLDLSQNSIGFQAGNGTIALAQALPSLTNLTDLDLSVNYFGSTDGESAVALMTALKNLTALHNLNLNALNLSEDPGDPATTTFALAESLPSLSALTRLDLGSNYIGCEEDKTVVALAKSLQPLSSLTSLALSRNCIGKKGGNGIIAFADTLMSFPLLQDLDLSYNNIGSFDLNSTIPLVNSISQLQNLNSLYIQQQHQPWLIPLFPWALLRQYWNHRNSNTDLYMFRSTQDIDDYLRRLTNETTSVPLGGQLAWINPTQITILMEGLTRLPSLQTLDLSNNVFNSTVLANTLPFFTQLTSFNLSYTSENVPSNWNENDTRAFAKALPSSLMLLDLSGNEMGYTNDGDAVTVALAEGLRHLTKLRFLDLSDVGIGYEGESGAQALGETLNFFPSLTHLDLSENWIGLNGDLGTLALANGLNATSQLKFLNLGNNNIGFRGSEGVNQLINTIPSLICHNLEEVNLLGNSFANIFWGPAADKLESLYTSQIQHFCQATKCSATPTNTPTVPDCSSSASSLTPPLIFRLFSFFPKREQLMLPSPLLSEDVPMGSEMVLFQEAYTPSLWESVKERFGEFQPSSIDLFCSSATKGAAYTFGLEMVRDVLEHGGVPKRAANMAVMAAQVGVIIYTTASYMPTVTGMAVNGGLTYMGAPSSVSSALGNIAAVAATSISMGVSVTPKNLALTIAGGAMGSTLALKAKNKLSSWLWKRKPVERITYEVE